MSVTFDTSQSPMGTLKAAALSNATIMSVTDDTSQPPMGALKAALSSKTP